MNELVNVNVRIENEQMITDSRNVADVFCKRHDHILRDVEYLKKDLPNFGEMFFEGTMPDSYGREQKVYFMNRDGFTLLAMGFTGSEALQWKLKYIEAFNNLEAFYNSPEQVMARALRIADQTIASLKDRCKMLGNEIEQKTLLIETMQPKVSYYDLILNCKGLMSATDIAKDYGMSARTFNHLLHNLRVQFKQGDRWYLYSKYENKGYTQSKTHVISYADGSNGSKLGMYWTQKGRLFLYDFLKSHDFVPVIEREAAEKEGLI